MFKRRRWLLLVVLFVVAIGLLARSGSGGPDVKTGSYLLVELKGPYVEAPPADLVGKLLGDGGQSLYQLLSALRAAKHDDRIAGILLRVSPVEMGWGKAREIRDALLEFRRSEKPLVAVIEQEIFGSNLEYYIASAAERVHLSPATTAPLTGLSGQFLFLGGLWEKLDVEMHVEKIREYKTMGDFLAYKEMTPAHREMANALLDSFDEQFVAGIAASREMEPDDVRRLIDECPSSPAEFETAGLSDGTQYLRSLHEAIGGEQTPLIPIDEYAGVDLAELGLNTGRKIAVLYATGSIVTGKSGGLQGGSMGADSIAEALDEVAKDDDVEALVMRVDSPGGSALASDLIWRARRAVQDRKPVVVSMSDLAASGGYYISVGANRIVAQPGTLTGSIGVVVVRPVVKDLLGNAGINVETISRGRYSYLNDLTVSLPPEGKAKLLTEVEHVYGEFVGRVAAGRKMTKEEVDAVGRGRVWTGEQAIEQGLVDELGGFWASVDAAKELAGIDVDEEVELVFYPRPKPLAERLADLMQVRSSGVVPEPLVELVNIIAPPFRPGSILTLMPYSFEVR